MSKRRIVIDGNIGSGKSTQLKLLEKMGFKVKTEPIDTWPLDLFYADKSRWAFLLQMSILRSFTEEEKEYVDVWERSPESSKYVFWKMLLSQGTCTKIEDDVYSYFFDRCSWKPDVHVYIRTTPEECFKRIQSRYQEGDCSITLEYLQEVHRYYEEYISSHSDVIVIDGNKNPEEILRCITSAVLV